MTSPLYAIHGDNSLDYDGYVVLTRGIGHNPNDHNGEDFTRLRWTPIVRLNNGYGDQGTIPVPSLYADFAQRCANFVRASRGCHIWIIGNEPNVEWERPDGQPITPGLYAECYTLCREAIRSVEFHDGDQVLVAPIGPWNVDTKYAGNPSGDWVRYFEDVQYELPILGCDGFALHAYARTQTPASIASAAKMDPPFEHYHSDFRVYWDWMAAILPRFQGLPVHITEFCIAGVPWQDANTGVVRAAYDEIDGWNTLHPSTPIHSLALYRWQYDQWHIDDKPNVHTDFYSAVEQGYTWPQNGPEPPGEETMQNPSFELPYHQEPGLSTVKVADKWRYFASSGAPPLAGGSSGPCQLPEYKPAPKAQDPRRVIDGDTAQCWFIRWKVMDGGIYQRIAATVGATYQFDVAAQAWCSDDDDPTVSDGEMYVSLGIDPNGGTDAFSTGVAWTEWDWIGADYKRLESPAVLAGAGTITVFIRAANKWALSHNDVYVDDAHLTVGGGGQPPGGGDVDYDLIRQIVREELDKTVWVSGAG